MSGRDAGLMAAAPALILLFIVRSLAADAPRPQGLPFLAGMVSSPAPAAVPDGKPPASRDLAALWRDACLWEVGSNTEKVPAARRDMIAAGDKALDFLIPSKLDTKDTLVTRALSVVITGIGNGAVPRLVPCLKSENANVRRNAADLLGALGAAEAAPAIAVLLDDPDARLGALAALGQIKSQETAPRVAALMAADAPERVRYTAAATLGAIGGPEAIQALSSQLASPSAPLRYAAQFALESLAATEALRARLHDPERSVRLHAIAALGRIKNTDARPDLLPLLDDPDPIVRGYAAGALVSMLQPSDQPNIEARLARETDPFARGKLRGCLQP